MAVIEVDHKVLRDIAEKIKDYCNIQDEQMKIADRRVKAMLTTDWIGSDAQHFGGKWEGVDEKDSISVRLRDSLEKLSGGIVACADVYQKAQEDSYNEALGLLINL